MQKPNTYDTATFKPHEDTSATIQLLAEVDINGHTYQDVETQGLIKLGDEYSLKKDYKRAKLLWEKAAKNGDAQAYLKLASHYRLVEWDYHKSVECFKAAARAGSVKAQCHVGELCYGSNNYKEALKWFHKAAQAGDTYAQRRLGNMYYNGTGVRKDLQIAAEWYHKSASQEVSETKYDDSMTTRSTDGDIEQSKHGFTKTGGKDITPLIYIVYYPMSGHICKIAKEVQKGLESEGVRVKIFEIPNIFSKNDIISKIIVRSRNNIPVISVDKLMQADGILWGIPIRFGSMPVQVKAFLDETSQLWTSGALAGKFTGIFFSSANRHDLQETTAFAALANFYRHGMLYIPLGFADHSIFTASDVTGGSVYGAGTFENEDGSREPTMKEIEMAIHQGKTFAKTVYAYYRGTCWETHKSKDQLSEKDGKVTSRDAVQIGNKRNMIKNHKLSSGDTPPGAPPIVCMPMEMVGLEYTIL